MKIYFADFELVLLQKLSLISKKLQKMKQTADKMLKFANIKPMTDIPNTEYITINENGFFIGDKKVIGEWNYNGEKPTLFHGHTMSATESFATGYVRFGDWFKSIQRHIPNIEEIHVGAFDTKATKYEQGFPSGKFGAKTWCRIKLKGKDATYSPWVFYYEHSSDWACVSHGGLYCVKSLANEPEFRSALLKAANTDTKQSEQQQKPLVQLPPPTPYSILYYC